MDKFKELCKAACDNFAGRTIDQITPNRFPYGNDIVIAKDSIVDYMQRAYRLGRDGE